MNGKVSESWIPWIRSSSRSSTSSSIRSTQKKKEIIYIMPFVCYEYDKKQEIALYKGHF